MIRWASKRLLDEAGYADASTFPEIECLCSDYSTAALVGQYMGSQWQRNLDVTAEWQSIEWSSYLKRLIERLPNVWLMGWGADYPDPDNFFRLAIMDRSATVWENPEYFELVEQARRSLDHAERMQLYEQAQNILIEEVPVHPLLYHRGHLLLKPWIAEYPISPMRWDHWKDVVIEPQE